MDHETVPFQCNLTYQVPCRRQGDYIGRAALERVRAEIAAGRPPFSMVMVGMKTGGKPIDNCAPDFWLVSDAAGGDPTERWSVRSPSARQSIRARELARARGEDAAD